MRDKVTIYIDKLCVQIVSSETTMPQLLYAQAARINGEWIFFKLDGHSTPREYFHRYISPFLIGNGASLFDMTDWRDGINKLETASPLFYEYACNLLAAIVDLNGIDPKDVELTIWIANNLEVDMGQNAKFALKAMQLCAYALNFKSAVCVSTSDIANSLAIGQYANDMLLVVEAGLPDARINIFKGTLNVGDFSVDFGEIIEKYLGETGVDQPHPADLFDEPTPFINWIRDMDIGKLSTPHSLSIRRRLFGNERVAINGELPRWWNPVSCDFTRDALNSDSRAKTYCRVALVGAMSLDAFAAEQLTQIIRIWISDLLGYRSCEFISLSGTEFDLSVHRIEDPERYFLADEYRLRSDIPVHAREFDVADGLCSKSCKSELTKLGITFHWYVFMHMGQEHLIEDRFQIEPHKKYCGRFWYYRIVCLLDHSPYPYISATITANENKIIDKELRIERVDVSTFDVYKNESHQFLSQASQKATTPDPVNCTWKIL